jgi:DNA-binding PadR family transcriptional regulator
MRERTTSYVLLGGLAAGGPMTGYNLRAWIEATVGDFWSESFGQIYPELRRLAADGLISPAETGSGEGKPYRITAAGRAVLIDWLSRSPQAERVRSELLLKLHFGRFLGTETAAGLISGALDRAQRRLAELEDDARRLRAGEVRGEERVFALLVAERGLAAGRAELAWAERAASAVAALEEGGPDAALAAIGR